MIITVAIATSLSQSHPEQFIYNDWRKISAIRKASPSHLHNKVLVADEGCPGSEESKQMPRPSRGRGRGTAFGRSRPAANTVAPVAAIPPESGPKRYSIQRGQRTVPGQAVKDNTLMSIVKDNTLMSVVTDPQQQKDLLSLASGPGPGPQPAPPPSTCHVTHRLLYLSWQ